MNEDCHDKLAAMDLGMITVALTPSYFNNNASLFMFFIIPISFCFVFEHEIKYTIRVLAVFYFYHAP